MLFTFSREADNAYYRATRCLRKTCLDRPDRSWLHGLVAAWAWRPRFHHRERKNGMRTAPLAEQNGTPAAQDGLDAVANGRQSLEFLRAFQREPGVRRLSGRDFPAP